MIWWYTIVRQGEASTRSLRPSTPASAGGRSWRSRTGRSGAWRFQRTLAELSIRHIRTQIDTPWTNGKIEAFWATLQSEVLDRQRLADLAAAEAAVTAYAGYYNYHRLQGQLDWQTSAERFDGTLFTDRDFTSVPALTNIADLPDAIRAAGPGLIFTGELHLAVRIAALRYCCALRLVGKGSGD